MKEKITQSQLKELLDYNPETGIFTWIKGRRLGKIAGCPNYEGYLVIAIPKKQYRAHCLAWLFVYGEFPKKQIDHINGIVYDNRFVNLRECNGLQNQWNSKIRCNNTSGFKGVGWSKRTSKWQARIRIFGNRVLLGFFDDPQQASIAYETKAKELHGAFYRDTRKPGKL